MLLLNPVDSFPFKTSIGMKPDKYNAGYDPARKPTTITMTTSDGASQVNDCSVKPNCLPATWLNNGKSKMASAIAMKVETRVTKVDSVRNWAIKFFLADPKTF